MFQRENWGVGGEVSRVRKVKNHKEPVSEDAVGGVCVCQLADVGARSPSSNGEVKKVLAVLGLPCWLSPSVKSRGYSLVVVCGFLIAVASLLMEHGL